MSDFTIRIDGLNDAIAAFKKAGANYEPVMLQAMRNSVMKLKADTRGNIVNKGIQNTGNLTRSVGEREITASRGVMGVGEKYGAYVEYGTKPHFPPVAPIERWAKTKLGVSGLGFLIARKIGRFGTKAQPYVEPAWTVGVPYVQKQFIEAIDTVVKMMAR